MPADAVHQLSPPTSAPLLLLLLLLLLCNTMVSDQTVQPTFSPASLCWLYSFAGFCIFTVTVYECICYLFADIYQICHLVSAIIDVFLSVLYFECTFQQCFPDSSLRLFLPCNASMIYAHSFLHSPSVYCVV